jgi:hypothetical protein
MYLESFIWYCNLIIIPLKPLYVFVLVSWWSTYIQRFYILFLLYRSLFTLYRDLIININNNNIFVVKKKIIPLKHVLWFWAYVNCFIFMSYPVKNFLGCLRNIWTYNRYLSMYGFLIDWINDYRLII